MARTSRTSRTARRDDLRQMLLARQAELQEEVRGRMGQLRTMGPAEVHRMDDGSDADCQQDIDLAMIQLRAEMSRKIEAALERMDAGGYGDCAGCGDEIPTKRLQALPYAIRCMACEGDIEHADLRSK